jgi:carbon-monoxide dehydrogenase small subunit
VSSCCYLAADADGTSVLTCEGIADGSHLSRLQREFVRCGAFQCGYCTPGMLLAATSLLETNSAPSREEVVRYMEGNLCRCTGYARIVEAILAAATG